MMMSLAMMAMMGGGVFVLFLPLLLIGAVLFSLGRRPQTRQSGSTQASQSPVEILRERYANGEIGREEYDQIRQDLDA